jgi:hypothetical protein
MLHVWTDCPEDEFYEPRFLLFGVWNSCVCVLFFVCEVGLGIVAGRRANHHDRDVVDLARIRNNETR